MDNTNGRLRPAERYREEAEETTMKPGVRRGLKLAGAGARAGLRLIGGAISLLAMSAWTTPAKDELNSSIRGGVLNYRTGKLDDGTDPYGWYERD